MAWTDIYFTSLPTSTLVLLHYWKNEQQALRLKCGWTSIDYCIRP